MLAYLHTVRSGRVPVTVLGTFTESAPAPFTPRERVRVRVNADRYGYDRGTVHDADPSRVTDRDTGRPVDAPPLPSDAPEPAPLAARWLV